MFLKREFFWRDNGGIIPNQFVTCGWYSLVRSAQSSFSRFIIRPKNETQIRFDCRIRLLKRGLRGSENLLNRSAMNLHLFDQALSESKKGANRFENAKHLRLDIHPTLE